MKSRYRLFRRKSGIFFCEDRNTGKQQSLLTRDPDQARRLFHARNEADINPLLNRQIARSYLLAADPSIASRTWRHALDELVGTKNGSNARRWANVYKDKSIQKILNLIIVDTRAEDFLHALNSGKVSTNVYLRRLHNFAQDMDWALKAVIPKRQWPKVQYGEKRAITEEEHKKIVDREHNPERRWFYELCWALGGSQGDIACLNAKDIDWNTRVLCYERKKTRQPALVRIDGKLEVILRALPSAGPLFPYLRSVEAKDRANEFRQRCHGLGITGVTLHSCHQDIHLKSTNRIAVGCINALACRDQRHSMSLEFIQNEGQMGQGTTKPIQFEDDNPLDLVGAHRRHESIQAWSNELRPGNLVGINLSVMPFSALAVGIKLVLLAGGCLVTR